MRAEETKKGERRGNANGPVERERGEDRKAVMEQDERRGKEKRGTQEMRKEKLVTRKRKEVM